MEFFKYETDPKVIREIFSLALACVTFICWYGRYRATHPKYRDPLMRKLGIGDLDGWSLTHYAFYSMYGYRYPTYWWCAYLCGCIWEAFEHWYGETRPSFLGGFADYEYIDPNIGHWWYGKWSDLVLNALGIISGMIVKYYVVG